MSLDNIEITPESVHNFLENEIDLSILEENIQVMFNQETKYGTKRTYQ